MASNILSYDGLRIYDETIKKYIGTCDNYVRKELRDEIRSADESLNGMVISLVEIDDICR